MRVLSRTWQMLPMALPRSARPAARGGRDGSGAHCPCADLPTPDEVVRCSRAAERAPRAEPVRRRSAGADHSASRFEARQSRPRGAPRAALAPSSEPVVRAPEPERVLRRSCPAVSRSFARRAETRPRRQARARARRGRAARTVNSRSPSSGAPRGRWSTISRASYNGPTGAGWWWCRRSRASSTVRSQNEARQAELKSGVRADPLVGRAGAPGAEIVDVRKGDAASPPPLPTGEPEEAEHAPDDDDGSAFGAHVRPDDEL